ncbi:hypothetical protein RKD49_005368 [Streptomyces glaucescens]
MAKDSPTCDATLVTPGGCDREQMYRIEVQMSDKPWVAHVCGDTRHQGLMFHALAVNAKGNPLTIKAVE